MRLFIIISILFLSFTYENERQLKIIIPNQYSGWGFVVSSYKLKSVDPTLCNIDNSGICYIDSATINNDFLPTFYKDGKMLSQEEVKFFFVSDVNELNRKIFVFYVLSNDELKINKEFWRVEENRKVIREKQYVRLDSLIKNGVIRAN